MRKVVIEISRRYLGDFEKADEFESWKVIHNFRSDSKGYAGICKLKLRDPEKNRSNDGLKALIGSFGITSIKPIARDKDGSHIAYVEGRRLPHWIKINSPREGYQYPPFELTPKVWRKTFLGSEGQIRKMLKKFEMSGMHFKIVWAGEAKFNPGSLISSLTESQKRTIATAYEKGYYDFPRKIDSAKLARALNLSKSTVSEHLRKGEKSILAQVFAE